MYLPTVTMGANPTEYGVIALKNHDGEFRNSDFCSTQMDCNRSNDIIEREAVPTRLSVFPFAFFSPENGQDDGMAAGPNKETGFHSHLA